MPKSSLQVMLELQERLKADLALLDEVRAIIKAKPELLEIAPELKKLVA